VDRRIERIACDKQFRWRIGSQRVETFALVSVV
jgi:hypothetical protein